MTSIGNLTVSFARTELQLVAENYVSGIVVPHHLLAFGCLTFGEVQLLCSSICRILCTVVQDSSCYCGAESVQSLLHRTPT